MVKPTMPCEFVMVQRTVVVLCAHLLGCGFVYSESRTSAQAMVSSQPVGDASAVQTALRTA
jgi:hypothetical protein